MKTLIRGARIATSEAVFPGDVLIKGEVIAAVQERVPESRLGADTQIVDAEGMILMPGGVDAHTHMDLFTGSARASDDFYTGTVAAACGGTTTLVDHMGFGPAGCALRAPYEDYRRRAQDAVIDYGLHGVIQHVDEAVLRDMESLAAEGLTSYKVYLTYAYKLGDADVLRVLERAAALGLIVCVHCENDAIVQFLTAHLLAAGKTAPRYHPRSRPAICEAEAVYRMLALAGATGDAPLYIVHLSTELGLEAVRQARARGQRNVFAETCPQYLLLDQTRYEGEDGLKYIMSPPLREASDNIALWRGLRAGDLDAVATDHCPFFYETQKQAGKDDFSRCPGGVPGVEARMALMYAQGVQKGRLTLPEMVRVCCTRPAQVFGLYPQKGDIRVGSDADLVLFDPQKKYTLSKARLHENVDYTPYEGMEMQGAPVRTWSRGECIVRDGAFVGAKGRGRYIRRGKSMLLRG